MMGGSLCFRPMPLLQTISTRFARIPAPVRGAIWMVISCFLFSLMSVILRKVTAEFHPFLVTFWRNVFCLMFLTPWVLRDGIENLRTRRIGLHAVRAVSGLAALITWITALSLMPIAEVTALGFTTPLFVTVGAAIILREAVGMRRWLAVAVGFGGAMIILRPGVETVSPAALVALGAAAFMASSFILVKKLSATETPMTIVFYMALIMLPLSAVLAAFQWTMPPPHLWPWLIGIGVLATIVQMAMTKAFSIADVTAVMPFDFTKLIFAAFLGFVFFAEIPGIWTWAGAAVIFSATVYTVRREARRSGQ